MKTPVHLLKPLFAVAVAIAFCLSTSAQAGNHCDPRVQAVGGPVAQDLSNLVATRDRPCQGIENQIATTRRQIAEAENDLEAVTLEREYWRQEANKFIKGQQAIIDKNFGENIFLTTVVISTELVLDALVVTKAAKGAKYGAKAAAMSGTVRTAMLAKLRREFQEALASEILSKGQAVMTGIQSDEWSWWDLVPFVSPVKKLNKMAGTDDAIAALGEAQRFASAKGADAYKRKLAAEKRLNKLRNLLGEQQEQLGRCKGQAGT
jgi:hypothetical protein